MRADSSLNISAERCEDSAAGLHSAPVNQAAGSMHFAMLSAVREMNDKRMEATAVLYVRHETIKRYSDCNGSERAKSRSR
jgi:hypothetical protein